jgi:hypothetical protein
MIQIQDSHLGRGKQRILCSYSNASEHTQIVRISDIASWYERVAFPGEELLFEALPEARLEINSAETPSTILVDDIPCSQLAIGLTSHVAEHLRSIKVHLYKN